MSKNHENSNSPVLLTSVNSKYAETEINILESFLNDYHYILLSMLFMGSEKVNKNEVFIFFYNVFNLFIVSK